MKKVVIGVSGGIAAYKIPSLASMLVKAGYDVYVCMTKKACEFITPLAFEAVTHNKCILEDSDVVDNVYNQHIRLGTMADLYIVVPATANTIAKISSGIADNIVTEVAIVTKAPILVAPAMNTNMYENEFTQDNIRKLREKGIDIIEPDEGHLACNTVGVGRLRNIEYIFDKIEYYLKEDKDLLGKKVLINAGPTKEMIDAVRYITNHSTGKMGYELARAAINRGAEVTLISGETSLTKPYGIAKFTKVVSAEDMFNETTKDIDSYDIIILTAAVADYTPKNKYDKKLKKTDDTLEIDCIRTKDILKFIGNNKKSHQKVCGFCMETENLVENAKLKFENKNLDMIVANSLLVEGAGFGTDTNIATLIKKDKVVDLEKMSKYDMANRILDELR